MPNIPYLFTTPIGDRHPYQYNEPVRISTLSVLLLFFLGACSPDPAPQSVSTPSTEDLNKEQQDRYEKALKPRFVHFGEAEDHLPLFDFECEDCPVSFGQFIATKVDSTKEKPARKTSNCQGGLVDDDLFLTNRHCLPEELQEKGLSCEGQVKIIFPKVNDIEGEIVGCKEVVDFYARPQNLDRKEPQPDWALIKLDKKLKNRVTPMDKSPIPDQTEVVAFVPVAGQNPDYVELKQINCVSYQNTLSLPEYLDEISPVAFFECDQDVTKGYSGTLLFKKVEDGNENLELKPIATLSHIWDYQRNKEDIIVSKFIVASTFQCVSGEDPLDEKCQFDHEKENSLKQELVLRKINPLKELIAQELTQYRTNEHPILWDDINIEEVKAGQSTKNIVAKWRHLIERENPRFLDESARATFFETLVQFQPRCLKKAHIPTPHKEVKTNIPVMTLRVHRDSRNRVEVLHEVRHVPVEILVDAKDNSQYTFKRLEPRPPFEASESSILSYRINHLATSVPPCP